MKNNFFGFTEINNDTVIFSHFSTLLNYDTTLRIATAIQKIKLYFFLRHGVYAE